jgi:hypothetical protein
MPNHTNVSLYFAEDALALVAQFTAKNDNGERFLDFNKLVPEPAGLMDKPANKKGLPAWYSWRNKNWGTKWNSYDCEFECGDEKCVVLHTAWSPPTPVIAKLAKKLKQEIRMTYIDEGFNYWGQTLFMRDGKYVDYCYSDVKQTPKELDEELGISRDLGDSEGENE